MLDAGAARVVLGTALLRDPALARSLIAAHGPEAIVAALDVRDGQAMGDGWTAGATARDVDASLAALADEGVIRFVVTAIARDGALGGPDLDLLRRLVGTDRGAIVASGGIASDRGPRGRARHRLRRRDRRPGALRRRHRPRDAIALWTRARPDPPVAVEGGGQCAAASTCLRWASMILSATWPGTSS